MVEAIRIEKFRRAACALVLLVLAFGASSSHAAAAPFPVNAEAEVREAMQRAFERLRAGDYGGIYDALPSASQRRVTRERFVGAMQRAQGIFELNRLEIGRVRVSGDLAVVDTVLYARVRQPIESEGKLVSRQYLLREGGQWRITTGDMSTVRPLLASNRAFARQFPPTEPRVYLKRDGRWVSMDALRGARRRRG